jgi:hypothetical protein
MEVSLKALSLRFQYVQDLGCRKTELTSASLLGTGQRSLATPGTTVGRLTRFGKVWWTGKPVGWAAKNFERRIL